MQTDQTPTLDPEAFAIWVQRVADINERFAEALHNAADVIAIEDPQSAIPLYQAVDMVNDTIHALRISKPIVKEKATTKPVVALGMFCGLLATYILDLI